MTLELSWLDRLSGAVLRYLALDMPQRGTIEFVGSGVTLTDNAANDTTVVTIPGAGSPATATGPADAVQVSDGAGGFVEAVGVRAQSDVVTLGTAILPTTGNLRFGFGLGFGTVRNVFNSDDRTLFKAETVYGLPSKDHVWFGSEPGYAALKTFDVVHVNANNTLFLRIASDPIVTIADDSVRSSKPLLGDASPYGSHGEANLLMADADLTVVGDELGMFVLTVAPGAGLGNPPFTSDHTLSVPAPSNDARAYTKFVRNKNGAGFNVFVSCGVGTPVTLPDGFAAFVLLTSSGPVRMTADIAT